MPSRPTPNCPQSCSRPIFTLAMCSAIPGRDQSLEPMFFVHRSGGKLYYHAFHLGIAPGAGLTDIQSPYGYGGLPASTHDPAFLSAAVQAYACMVHARRRVLAGLRSVFTPCSPTGDIIPEEIRPLRHQTVWIERPGNGRPRARPTGARTRAAIRKASKGPGSRVSKTDSTGCWQDFPRLYTAAMERFTGRPVLLF